MRTERIISFNLRSKVCSSREQEVLGHLLGDGNAPILWSPRPPLRFVRAARGMPWMSRAAMLVEALVFGGQKRIDQALRDGATRHINAPLTRELAENPPSSAWPRQHGRLVFGEPLVVRQVLGHLPEDETHSTRPGEKHDGADRDHETKETSQETATPPRSFQRLFGRSFSAAFGRSNSPICPHNARNFTLERF